MFHTPCCLRSAQAEATLVIGNRIIVNFLNRNYVWKILSVKCVCLCRNNKNKGGVLCKKEKVDSKKGEFIGIYLNECYN